jgi:hypothetical protein
VPPPHTLSSLLVWIVGAPPACLEDVVVVVVVVVVGTDRSWSGGQFDQVEVKI